MPGEQHEPPPQVELAPASHIIARHGESFGAAPAITRMRSPSFAISASRTAIACVGTTTASACLTARFSIAFCHATLAFGYSPGLPTARDPRS